MNLNTNSKPKKNKQDFFWRMKAAQDTVLIQTAGSIAFFVVISLINRSLDAGIAFMAAMYFHERGHLFFFIKYGVDAHVRNIFPLGMVAAPKTKEENARSDTLPWWQIANILQAGPAVNAVQLAFGVAMMKLNILPDLAYFIVYMNGMLGLFNLLPLGNMDGGQLFHVIFSSMKKEYDIALSIAVSIVAVGATYLIIAPNWSHGAWGVAYSVWQNIGWLPFLILFAAGLAHKQGRDNDEHWKSTQAMTPIQIAIQLALYFANVALMLWLFSI